MRFICFVLFVSFFMTFAHVFSQTIGIASYYSDKLKGRKTASGALYYPDSLTCAHKNLPFGTKLRVVNLLNNKEIILTVNDRGPYHKSRILDVSKAAATQLDMIQQGVVKISYEIIEEEVVDMIETTESSDDDTTHAISDTIQLVGLPHEEK